MEPNDRGAASVDGRTQERLVEMEARYKDTGSLSNVILILGRSGVGKSSLLEDLTGSHGHSEQSVDTGTTNIQIEKAVLRGKEYFIMDTPGFDPGNEETTFIEITRGINAVSAFARVIGMLFLNCINQPRFDAFDRKLVSFIRTLSGNEFFPRVTFVTTFWTPVNAKQQTAFNQRLASLRQNWQMSASTQEQQSYQHGHVYSEGGEDTGSFLNWFESRDQIAQYAREIIGHRSEGSNAQRNHNCNPDIVKELCAGTRLQDTEAGRLLGIAPPNPNPNSNSDTSSHESDSSPSNGSSQEQPEEAAAPTNTGSATETESYSQTSFGNLLMEGVSWFFRNVNFDVNFGGAGPGGQTFGNSQPRDPLSSVDTFKSFGLDSSLEGRTAYARRHGIPGAPGAADWNDNVRRHLNRRRGW